MNTHSRSVLTSDLTAGPEVLIANPRKNKVKTGQSPQPTQIVDQDEDEGEIVLKYGAQHVIKLFIPVTICLLFVIISLSLIKSYQQSGGAHLYA